MYARATRKRTVVCSGRQKAASTAEAKRARVPPNRLKNPSSDSIIVVNATDRVQVPVRMSTDANAQPLDQYMKAVPGLLETLQFPMGASIEQCGEDQFDLNVPELKFNDVSVRPVTRTFVSVDDAGVLEFTCDSASLRCSSHVENLGLDERFELDVRVTLRPDATCLTADASVAVTVDLPMPFSLLPKPVLNQLSDGVMQTMSSLFLRQFVEIIASDFGKSTERS